MRVGVETYFLSADASDATATAVAARENADRLAGEPEIGPGRPSRRHPRATSPTRRRAHGDARGSRTTCTTGSSSRLGVPDRGVKQAPFYVLAGARMPAVLLEVGFISHPAESRRSWRPPSTRSR